MKNIDNISVFELLVKHELVLADLYAAYAHAFPGMCEFWNQLVVEEKAHADVLKALSGALQTKRVFVNHDRFKEETIQTVLGFVKKFTEKVKTGSVTKIEMLSTAMDLEQSALEKNFFNFFDTQDVFFLNEFKQLADHTSVHAGRIEKLLSAERLKLKSSTD